MPTSGRFPFDQAPVPLFAADRQGRLLSFNDAVGELFGAAVADRAESLADLLGPGAAQQTLAEAHLGTPVRVVCPAEGSCRHLEIRARMRGTGQDAVVHGAILDVTEWHSAQSALRRAATHDALTGLPLPSLLLERVDQALAHAGRDQRYRFAVLFLDLDRFKVINDSYGHAVGDRVLTLTVERLRGCLRRAGDAVSRFGGDEFAILLDDVPDGQHALRLAEAVQAELRSPFAIDGLELFTDSSVGVVLGGPEYASADAMLRDADTAMYRAKSQGRGCAEIFDARMHEEAVALSRLEMELRRALERDEFELAYQPMVALGTAEVIGFEALIRWRRDGEGLAQPSSFLRLAEETGLIVRIGTWALREACRQAAGWRAAGFRLRVAVNLSSLQFRQRDLSAVVMRVLEETGVAPRDLELEVTEGSVLEDPEAGIRTLHRLHELGVRLSVDDFGTGCFSLAQLKRLPVDTVKIDQALVHDIARDPGDAAIAKAVIDLGHSLGLQVIAEGVEGAGQLSFLRAHGCDALQGYYFERPISAAELATLLGGAGGNGGNGGPPGARLLRLPGHPAISVAAVEAPPGGGGGTGSDLRGVRILLVDDESGSRLALAALLELAGAEVESAATAAEALELLRRRRPHVMVSDIGLPDQDGYALVRRVRALPVDEGGGVPAIALTGYSRSEDRVRAFQAGYQAHTAKPVQPAELVAVVASLARMFGTAPGGGDEVEGGT